MIRKIIVFLISLGGSFPVHASESGFAFNDLPTSLVFTMILIAASGVLVFFSWFYHLKMYRAFSDLESSYNHLERIIFSSEYGYVFISPDPEVKHLQISANLTDILSITGDVKTLDDLLQCFNAEEQQSIVKYINELRVGKLNFYQRCTIKQPTKTAYIECKGKSLRDDQDVLLGIILWFHDISVYNNELEKSVSKVKSLKSELKYFSVMLNNLPFPIWRRNKNLEVSYCNLAYSHIVEELSINSLESSGGNVMEITPNSYELASRAQETKEAATIDEYLIYGGKRYLYKIVEAPLDKEQFQIGYGENITPLEKLQKEIEYHKTAQADILESSSSAMAMFGSNKRLKFHNQAFTRLWELDEKWLASNPSFGDFLETLREQRKLPEQVNFPKYKTELLSWFTDLIEPYNDFLHLPDGKALRVIAIPHALGGIIFAYEDMTDRLRIERSYNTLIAVQKATLDNLHEALVVFGQNGKMELYNPKFAKIWDLDEAFLQTYPHISEVFERCKDLYKFHGDWQEFKNTSINEILRRKSGFARIERNDDLVLDAVCAPLPDGGVLLTYIDVTAQTVVELSLRQRNEALEEADKLKTEFLANVSYELRSPLTSIVGFSEVLNKQYFGILNDKQKEYIDGIYKSSQYLMSLINDTLDLASIEAGYMSLDVEEFDIFKSLTSVLVLIRERIRENGLEFSFDCEDNIGSMYGDERRFKQLVFKLLSNAIKFTEAGGSINLEAYNDNSDNVVISVADNGIGIPKEEQGVVFDKFYKTESSKAYNRSGAGLGLSVVKNFVELHGGHITLESEPGKGTNVLCYLPKNNESLKQMSKWKHDA
ncbi:MAG: ATP-binding protein [Rickettsiales bacterium]|nr:ATP-binding protein [Rickettsiales bacterium]